LAKSFKNSILASALLAIGAAVSAMPALAAPANANSTNPFQAGPAAQSFIVSSSMTSLGMVAVISGKRGDYTITRYNDKIKYIKVVHNSSKLSETFTGPVRLKFADMNAAWNEWSNQTSIPGPAASDGPAQIYRLYHAAFNRSPDLVGLGYWIHVRDGGATLDQIAVGFVQSAEMGNLTNEQFLNKIHMNLNDHNGVKEMPKADRDRWMSEWDAKKIQGQDYAVSRGQFLVLSSESVTHRKHIGGQIMHSINYIEYKAAP
jgi:hypothetical protein